MSRNISPDKRPQRTATLPTKLTLAPTARMGLALAASISLPKSPDGTSAEVTAPVYARVGCASHLLIPTCSVCTALALYCIPLIIISTYATWSVHILWVTEHTWYPLRLLSSVTDFIILLPLYWRWVIWAIISHVVVLVISRLKSLH